jgi:hypothetical protein
MKNLSGKVIAIITENGFEEILEDKHEGQKTI